MYTRKLYATGSATANQIATLVVPVTSRLVAVQWAVKVDSVTDNSSLVLELSYSPATEVAVNGAQQCISEFAAFVNLLTSGMFDGGKNHVMPVDAPFKQGQLLYLHAGLVAGTLVYTGGCILWFR